jgi:cytochrome P450
LSFGLGIHRCPGVHLARIMFAETLKAVLERLPDYRLDEGGIVEYPNWGALGGWSSIPATFSPAR